MHRRCFRLAAVRATLALAIAVATASRAVARDFGAPPSTVVIPAPPTAAGPAGVPDDEPGNNVNERVDSAEQANKNGMSEADRKVMKAIRDGVKHSPPPAAPARKRKHSEQPLEH